MIYRLNALLENLTRYGSQIELVDAGVPTNINVDIYGTGLCLESKKAGFQNKPYHRLNVIRNAEQIHERTVDFNTVFEEIKVHNLKEAAELPLNDYLKKKIRTLITSM